MPAPHPRMHGITHVTGGPDPIPGLLPAPGSRLDEVILATDPVGLWKLDETAGSVAADSSGNGHDLTAVPPERDPLWAAGAGPPGTPAADFSNYDPAAPSISGARVSRSWPTIDHSFTAGIWVRHTRNDFTQIVGQGDPERGSGAGWQLGIHSPITATPHQPYIRWSSGSGLVNLTAATVMDADEDPDLWVFLAAVHDDDSNELRIYVNGILENTAASGGYMPAAGTTPRLWVGHDGGGTLFGSHFIAAFVGSYAFLTNRALTAFELANINEAAGVGDPAGLVLVLDEDGNPVWAAPPGVDVTVNGSGQPASNTPTPTPPPPPADHDDSHAGADWIEDQPFLWGGGEFVVQPNTWTTIPWSSPLMERLSNSTPAGFGPLELDDDDPDSGGWVNDESDYTKRAIVIPHDVPFLTGGDWIQVCLHLEDPAVEPSTSHRALRVFETTRQKTVLAAKAVRHHACTEGGGIDVYREDAAHTLPSDGFIFAEGDTGGLATGDHGNTMFVPNAGYAYTLNGEDWLPRVAGVPTLKEGMRLVAQVWHDASEPLTFSCDNPFPYRPHFVARLTMDRAFGPPWSDWPEP